ncbi:EF-hand domain-containing protein [Wenyingzhuangia sp. IMCC45533]
MKSQKLIIAGVVCLLSVANSFSQEEKPKPSPEKIFKRLDKNKDGNITKDELAGKKILERFAKIDKDANESISLKEFVQFKEKTKKAHHNHDNHNHGGE